MMVPESEDYRDHRPRTRLGEVRFGAKVRWPQGEAAYGCQKELKERKKEPLQAPRGANSEAPPHQEPQVESADMSEQSFEDVHVPAQVRPAHPASLVGMRKGALQDLASLFPEPLTARPTDAATVRVGCALGGIFVLPVARPAVRLGDVAA